MPRRPVTVQLGTAGDHRRVGVLSLSPIVDPPVHPTALGTVPPGTPGLPTRWRRHHRRAPRPTLAVEPAGPGAAGGRLLAHEPGHAQVRAVVRVSHSAAHRVIDTHGPLPAPARRRPKDQIAIVDCTLITMAPALSALHHGSCVGTSRTQCDRRLPWLFRGASHPRHPVSRIFQMARCATLRSTTAYRQLSLLLQAPPIARSRLISVLHSVAMVDAALGFVRMPLLGVSDRTL